mgnify:CR=1 FL=1
MSKNKINILSCWIITVLCLIPSTFLAAYAVMGIFLAQENANIIFLNFVYPVMAILAVYILLYIVNRIRDKSFKECWEKHKKKIYLDKILLVEDIVYIVANLYHAYILYKM